MSTVIPGRRGCGLVGAWFWRRCCGRGLQLAVVCLLAFSAGCSPQGGASDGGVSTAGVSTAGVSTAAAIQKAIVSKAKELSTGTSRDTAVKACNKTKGYCVSPGQPPAYVQARIDFGTAGKTPAADKTLNYGGDCGNYVATVLRASGADPNYPASGTASQLKYLQTSNKWATVDNVGQSTKLEPGDIFVINNKDDDGNMCDHHTFIYIGNGEKAQASQGSQMPWYSGKVSFTKTCSAYSIFRLKGGV